MTDIVTHRGIQICRYDVPYTPFFWTHDETDGYGLACTVAVAKDQIDKHLAKRTRTDD